MCITAVEKYSNILPEQSHLPRRNRNFLVNPEALVWFLFDSSVHRNMFLHGEGLRLESGEKEAEIALLFYVFVISFPAWRETC